MHARGGATSTVAERFAAFLERSPNTATLEDIRLFQLHLAETGMSICNRNRIMTGVRFFVARVTLQRSGYAPEIYHLREPQKIPQVMSPDETRCLLAVATSLKARVLLSLSYGCSLRAGFCRRRRSICCGSGGRCAGVSMTQRPFKNAGCFLAAGSASR